MTLICISSRLGVKQKNVLLPFLKAFIMYNNLCQKTDKNISYQLSIMILICISNRLGVKLKNVFYHFWKPSFSKSFGCQKIDINISYQLDIMTLIGITNLLGTKHKNVFLSFLKAFIGQKLDLPIGGATYQKYYMPILSSCRNLWGVCVMIFLVISYR